MALTFVEMKVPGGEFMSRVHKVTCPISKSKTISSMEWRKESMVFVQHRGES